MQDSRSSSPATTARLTASQRLLREDGFDHVVRAEKSEGKYFNVFFVCNSNKNARLGIIASKKILPTAVARNSVKRLVRELFRQHKIKDSKLDLVVMARRSCAQEHGDKGGDLEMLFSRVENRCAEF